MPPAVPAVRCRQINEADIPAIARLLSHGFPRYEHQFWRRALDLLSKREPVHGCPRYGYLLESGSLPVGVILVIYSALGANDKCVTRCNLSSWYVEPEFRAYAALLSHYAQRHANVTYLNISPKPGTWALIEAQGFSRYCAGVFVTAPLLSGLFGGPRVRLFTADRKPDVTYDLHDQNLLKHHAAYGCTSLWCATSERAYPFVFRPRFVSRIVPCAQLIYCRDMTEFVRFAGPIGRYFALRGRPIVIADANGPLPGLLGAFVRDRPRKYFKGPHRPRVGDLAYTERAMWGV